MTQYKQDGFALPAALLAMVVIGAVVTGGFYAAGQEDRISASSAGSREAFYMAEYGIEEVVGTQFRPWYQSIAIGSTATASNAVMLNGDTAGVYDVTVRRLDDELYLITSEGGLPQRGYLAGRRQLAQVVKTENWDMPLSAALYVYGGISVTGTAEVDGVDADGGACNASGNSSVPGVISSDTSQVSTSGSGSIFGSPPVQEDATLDSTSLLNYGDVDFDKLAAQATITFTSSQTLNGMGPVVSSGVCVTSNSLNWGDPENPGQPCSSYYPIIYVNGDLNLQTGVGQGILLVEGDFRASGNFHFYGIVIVKGTLRTTGNGNHLNGVVIVNSGGIDLDSSAAAGISEVKYSSCSALNAMSGYQRAVPIETRSWYDATAAGGN
ncbi:MAG: pilus assembly PilX N-terminal domain-containing protein [Longimicrobiales bacterium]